MLFSILLDPFYNSFGKWGYVISSFTLFQYISNRK